MTPKNSNISTPCTSAISSTCVTWTGPSIPSLGIVSGQTMTDTLYKVACEVVATAEGLDLSDMDLSCLIEKTPLLPENKTVRLILQLLLDNQCSLKSLIDQSTGVDTGLPIIVVNMKCLKVFDAFGNELPQDLNQTLQSLINQVCTSVTDISSLKTTAVGLQNQIDNLPIPPAYVEPNIVTCITPTPKATSLQVPLLAQDYCNYKNVVGQVTDVQQAVARQPQGLNTLLGTVDGWILNPQNLSQSENNLWLLAKNLLDRVNNIESNCCKSTCKDITLSILATPNTDGDAVFIQFSTYLGTNIPNGFLDSGDSILTITDKNNKFAQYPITVVEDTKQGPFSFAGLDTSGPLTASVAASLTSGTLNCEKCVGKQFIPNSACPVCLVTGSGTTGLTTIVYQAPGQKLIQTLIIGPNSTGYIQKGASIIGIDSTGDSSVSSDCINLAAPPYVCVNVLYAVSGNAGTATPWENYNNDTEAIAIGIGGTEYAISGVFRGDPIAIANAIAAATPPGLIKVTGTDTANPAGVRYKANVYMKVPSTLVSTTYIKWKVVDYNPVEVYATTCDGCCGDSTVNQK